MTDAELREQLAIKLLGWRWISFFGVPVQSHHDYPDEMRVRLFVSPTAYRKADDRDADGTEPLEHRYESVRGPEVPPFACGWYDDYGAVVAAMEARGLTGRWHEAQEEACLHAGDLREALVLALEIAK